MLTFVSQTLAATDTGTATETGIWAVTFETLTLTSPDWLLLWADAIPVPAMVIAIDAQAPTIASFIRCIHFPPVGNLISPATCGAHAADRQTYLCNATSRLVTPVSCANQGL